MSDKTSIVDVKARDQRGTMYQIEVQIVGHRSLRDRIAYGWCDLYAAQLKRGDDYQELKPVVSIWLLADVIFNEDELWSHHFRLYDPEAKLELTEGSGIRLLELRKWNKEQVEDDEDRWVRFFREGEALDDDAFPEELNIPEMRQAMEVLKHFTEKERAYHLYQSRMNFLREQKTLQRQWEETQRGMEEAKRGWEEAKRGLEEAQRGREAEKRAREEEKQARVEAQLKLEEEKRARAEAESALNEKNERLLKALQEAGIDPDGL